MEQPLLLLFIMTESQAECNEYGDDDDDDDAKNSQKKEQLTH